MFSKHVKLTIVVLLAGLHGSATWAQEAFVIRTSTKIDSPAISATETNINPLAAETTPPVAATSAPEAPRVLLPEIIAGPTELPSIISIDSAPADATPLLKAEAALGNPQQDLWARIRVGFAMPELETNLVQENANWYIKRPDYVERMLERSKRYMYYIVDAVEQRGMPTEIALLPMVESGFNPKAYSSARASGLWQFIPSTGRSYGLQQNWWVDNRRDVIAATHAALDYLQKLHGMFGNWELALAAYNWGEGSVQRAIAKNKANGLPTDYLSLRMPKETQHYVPRLMAMKNLIQRPQDFGVNLGVVPNTPYFAQITLTQHIDVALAAKLSETTLDEFTALNPNYNRPVIQAHQPASLLLPVDKAEVFAANLKNYSKPLVSWQPYHAKHGEKLDAIAGRHGINVVRLKEINGISLKRGRLQGDQVLLVPGSTGGKLDNTAFSAIKPNEVNSGAEVSGGKIYTVRKGDTLLAIAKRHGVKAEQIKAWNRLTSNRLALNQKLQLGSSEKAETKPAKVATRATPATPEARRANIQNPQSKQKKYTVRRGDTLYSIAQRFDVELDDLLRWNKLSTKARLYPGDVVTILLAQNS